MKIKRILVAGTSVLVLVGGATGVAFASGDAGGGQPATENATGADTDNVQQGDQTTPDVSGSSNEKAGENAGETSGESDGPGGHADPAGNVDHQFEGSE